MTGTMRCHPQSVRVGVDLAETMTTMIGMIGMVETTTAREIGTIPDGETEMKIGIVGETEEEAAAAGTMTTMRMIDRSFGIFIGTGGQLHFGPTL